MIWCFGRRVFNPSNVLNGAHPSTVREASRQASSTAFSSEPVEESGRAEDRAGHGEPVEPLNRLNVWNGYFLGNRDLECQKIILEALTSSVTRLL
jgi:hypothetical protein